ncbi:ATPase [Pseudomonas sessilinigenes]|uniref:ATPase n=1 Tax=Pseudomonas sessilinigenes TaxID=658629 RepID=A0ABX8MQQ6_9PSED|nr:ATPase [Pseudomonas sessilinigenes]AZC26450.1 Chromosome segregation ATPase [Pseudomonas sessilinigenes]QXH39541.1 ATPase [Pseudomonas sessilinigenes]
MRNDAHDDFDDIPSLRAEPLDDDVLPTPSAVRERTAAPLRNAPAAKKPKGTGTGPLWALVGALFFAFIGLAWWSFQQISLMEQQLVATQESFARISEEAAGRLQDISGKVVASQTNVITDNEALKLQIKQLESRLQDQGLQQQGVAGQATDLDKRLEQMSTQGTEQQAANVQLQAQVKALGAELASLKGVQADGDKVDAQLKSLGTELAALKKQGNPGAAIERLEQDMIVLKSQQDNRPAAAQNGASTAEFDAFRGQVTRNINTLQSQIQNLQQQINTRP